MANNTQLRGTPFSVTASGTTSAQAVTTGTTVTYYVTDLTGSTTSTQGTWALLGGPTGTTVFWQGYGAPSEDFVEPIIISSKGTISFLVNGSAVTYANMSGYFI